MSKRIILFELNEVPYRIVDQFIKWRPHSNLGLQMGRCYQYETYTEDVQDLSPWITWPSMHRGVNDEKHGISEFGQDLSRVDDEFPPIWRVLAQRGVTVGVCGSLHSYPLPRDLNNYTFLVPDTFAAGKECFPNKLDIYQEFNLRMARDSARNVSDRVPWGAALRLLASAPELGFKLSTLADIAGHLAKERVIRWRNVRRRTYQAVLAFDVFMKQLQTTKPAFSTYFTNHVASSMHRYWAAAFPDDYEKFGYGPDWVRKYRHEIEFTMEKADEMIGRAMAFVNRNPEYALWVATSMGQEAIESNPLETQLYVQDLDSWMRTLGLSKSDWTRRAAMLPQFNILVVPDKAAACREALSSVRIGNEPLKFVEKEAGFFSMHFGHPNTHDGPRVVHVNGRAMSFGDAGLEPIEIKDKSGTNAYHIPRGCLLIYDPTDLSPKQGRPQVSTLDVAPTLLQNFGVQAPGYMHKPVTLGAPITGTSRPLVRHAVGTG